MAVMTTVHSNVNDPNCPEPRVVYSKRGDFLCVLLADDLYVAEQIDDTLTIHRRATDGEICGCTLAQFSKLARHVSTQVKISEGDIDLRVLLENVDGTHASQDLIYDLKQKVGFVHVPTSILRDTLLAGGYVPL